ncbi:hypothetical protein [Sphingobium sp. CAP-1]|uniref:hypothetical protein n=1 Tax=Sphingobium sp. CAP-1 TaxID=2676077 RepID=UPI0012BB2B1B|nr:hypothetical protein [Sphingobium sp. CAP-1]QGP80961.1 hypothetical protein GL174_17990 [Sphingobium sp. CAP-1]
MTRAPFIPLLAALLLAGCTQKADHSDAANAGASAPMIETVDDADTVPTNAAAAAADARLPTDDWVGRWTGPEGLFLDIQPSPNGKPGHYALTNRDNLDRQADYPGVADGATIRFVRDGQDLAIHPGKGDETGFKHLAGKADCLIVIARQEGYCR